MVRQGCVVVGHTMNYFLALRTLAGGPAKPNHFIFSLFILLFILIVPN